MAKNSSFESTVEYAQRDPLLAQIWCVPSLHAAVLTPDGTVITMNAAARRAFLGTSTAPAEGLSLGTLYGEAVSDEWIAIAKRVLATHQAHVIRMIRGGRGFESTQAPYHWAESGPQAVVSLTLPLWTGEADLDPSVSVSESRFVSLGRLDALTVRELEVLALLREPISVPRIAARLHRAMKTVDHHVTSIRQKLGISSRIEIARVADAAQLELRHAQAERCADPQFAGLPSALPAPGAPAIASGGNRKTRRVQGEPIRSRTSRKT